MKVTAESLHKQYRSMTTEALTDLYNGGLTDLAASVLKEVITSRGLDWAQFTKHSTTEPEPESLSDWSLWQRESGQMVTDETRDEPQHKAIGIENTEEFRAFVGPNWADFYQGAWTRILTGKGRGASFNWAAFFLAGIWLPYRKMYLATAIFYGVIFLGTTLEDVYFIGIRGAAKTPGLVYFGFNLLIGAICGAYGNRWYLSHAKRVIAVVGQQKLQRDTFHETLSNRGGRSLVSAIGVPILCTIVMATMFVVLVEPFL